MHGLGKMMFNNGMIFDGEWQEDMMVGNGSLTFSDGRIVRGVWNECNLIEGDLLVGDRASEYESLERHKYSMGSSVQNTHSRSTVVRLPEPSPELQELLKIKLKPYTQILLSNAPVKT